MTMDAIWDELSPEHQQGNAPGSLEGYKANFEEVRQQVQKIHNIAEEPFEDLAASANSILNPLMKIFNRKSEDKNNKVSASPIKMKPRGKIYASVSLRSR